MIDSFCEESQEVTITEPDQEDEEIASYEHTIKEDIRYPEHHLQSKKPTEFFKSELQEKLAKLNLTNEVRFEF